MFVLTPSMVTKYDLPRELLGHTTRGSMSHELCTYYEAVVGPAFKRVVEERPHVIAELFAGPRMPERGYNKDVENYLTGVASKRGMTATEYFFGLEPGYESLCDSYNDAQSILGMMLLREEPIEHLYVFREAVLRERHPFLEWGEVWRQRSGSSEDWFELWAQHMFSSQYLATAIRMGLPVDDCFRFMAAEKTYLELGLKGVPLTYALACGELRPEKIRRAWEDGLPTEYARTLNAS